ncbi:DUF4192 family protein [Isoptericola sp. BMS4]|uniref:DUF4192 family protein n=1 Tax=Isoptericola sp. BMS4 TaxID=2527875 RepID=UPI00141EFB2F|nr:DUF4192 family protein [Isoptericola sp. BMS4]
MTPTVATYFSARPDPTGPSDAVDGAVATVRARSSRDLLAAVPYLLGYRPRESLVVVCVGARGTVDLVVRVALDDLHLAGAVRDRASDPVGRLVAALHRTSATDLLIAVHTAREPSTFRPRVEPVLAALERVADVEPWLVSPHGYRGLDCDDAACCPPEGHPPTDLEHRAVNAALVVAGCAVADSPEDAYRIRPAPEPCRARAARAATRAERAGRAHDVERDAEPGAGRDAECGAERGGAPDVAGGAAARARRRTAGYDLWCELVRHAAREADAGPPGAAALPPARLGRLAVALGDLAVRDAVLLSLVPGGEDVARRTASARPGPGSRVPASSARGAHPSPDGPPGPGAGEDAADGGVEAATARAVARVVDPRVAVVPDPAVARSATLVLEQVVAHVPRRRHAPALTLLAFLAWWQGDGGRAAHRLQEATSADTGYRLAALLGAVLDAGVPPGWVRS